MKEVTLNIKSGRVQKSKKSRKGRFGKCVLIFSFSFVTIYSIWVMWEQHHTGMEPTPTLTQWIYSFWGIEVMMLCLKRIFAKPTQSQDDNQEG